ncbi:MAG: zinc ribbon domain-containing protein [Candidatus Methylomirabilales bacterium]
MPIYEFVCEECAHAFEKLVATSRSRVECPRCRSGKVTKQFSTFAFKGERGFVGSTSGGCAGCSSSGG